ncbi:MFS transporter [Solwaraspora sp. WMMD1047]|uniref:MFS transporter n=1 Tax=Solwaraspora sp. WMMD1047 TaxID=3016102 RepID=UPI002417A1FE|nr:MFS transporter [Solwaraspora sp. WMMD1047]MDG4828197.1 MFS transporter [Solwaraspora sp. WMMD1047]
MSSAQARTDRRAWGVLVVLCGAIFLEGIDVAMLNVALPAIRADLGLSTGMLSGVVSAYVLGYGGFMLLGGRAADLLGRRRMFLTWLVVFLVFSGLGGFATEGWLLLVARFITGVAAAFLAPAGLALITGYFPEGPLRTRALGVYAGIASGGFLLGLVAGGLLVSVGWRWVFFAPVLMSAAILLAAIPLIEEPTRPADGPTRPTGEPAHAPRTAQPTRPGESGKRFDLPGAVTITGAMLLLAYGVVRLEHGAAGLAGTSGVLAAGVALLALFVVIERRSADPLVRLGILRSAPLVRTNLGALLFMMAFAGFQFMLTLYLQELRGWSPLQTGLAMVVVAIDVALAPTVTPWLVNRFGNGRVLFVGMVLGALAYALFLPVASDWTYAAMLPSLLLIGLAFSLVYGPLTMAATEGVEDGEHGLAGGLLYTSIQFGTALGLSAVTAVAAIRAVDGSELDAIRAGLAVSAIAAALAATSAAPALRHPAPNPEPVNFRPL